MVTWKDNRGTWWATPKGLRERIQESGLTLNKEKSKFHMSNLEFMWHLLSVKGIRHTQTKVEAVTEARQPESASEVRSFLGYGFKVVVNVEFSFHSIDDKNWNWQNRQFWRSFANFVKLVHPLVLNPLGWTLAILAILVKLTKSAILAIF